MNAKDSKHLDYHERKLGKVLLLTRKQQNEPGIFEDQIGTWCAPNPPYQTDLQLTQEGSLQNAKEK